MLIGMSGGLLPFLGVARIAVVTSLFSILTSIVTFLIARVVVNTTAIARIRSMSPFMITGSFVRNPCTTIAIMIVNCIGLSAEAWR